MSIEIDAMSSSVAVVAAVVGTLVIWAGASAASVAVVAAVGRERRMTHGRLVANDRRRTSGELGFTGRRLLRGDTEATETLTSPRMPTTDKRKFAAGASNRE